MLEPLAGPALALWEALWDPGIVLPLDLPAGGAFDCGLFPKGSWELSSVGE